MRVCSRLESAVDLFPAIDTPGPYCQDRDNGALLLELETASSRGVDRDSCDLPQDLQHGDADADERIYKFRSRCLG